MDAAVASSASGRTMVPDIDRLAHLFVSAFPQMNADEQRLALTLYRMLARGAPVVAGDLAKTSRLPVRFAIETLSRWPGIFHDQGNAVIGFWGIAVQEMPHRLEAKGDTAFTWCAWDALFIPELLGVPARVTSNCAESGDVIKLEISPNGIESRSPPATEISFVVPDRADLQKNVTVSFCHFVHFLRDRDAGLRWISQHDGAFLLTLDQAFDLGRKVNRARYRDVLKAKGG